MDVTDEFIEKIFLGTDINGSTEFKRKILANSLSYQLEWYWAGSSIYRVMVNGGFLKDSKARSTKELTELGKIFLADNQ